MNMVNALGEAVDTLKKYNDSRYVRYDDAKDVFDYKTPQHYGAVGNGYADDTAAINQAIEENDVVYIPSGVYKISSSLVVAEAGKKIYGTAGTQIKAQGCDCIVIQKPSNTIMSDLEIIGDGSAHHGIVIDGSGYRSRFTNISVREFGGDGFHTNWVGEGGFGVCTIEKCKFHECNNGIVCLSDAQDQRNCIGIVRNMFSAITHTALRLTGVSYVIDGNNIESCEYGIRVHNWDVLPQRDEVNFAGSFCLRITSNYMETARRAFISLSSNYAEEPRRFAGVSSVVIENNYMYNNKNVPKSDGYTMVEFVTDTPDASPGFSDVTYQGNHASTEEMDAVVTINGSNLLGSDCRFTLPVYNGTVTRLTNMGDAIVVNHNINYDAEPSSDE